MWGLLLILINFTRLSDWLNQFNLQATLGVLLVYTLFVELFLLQPILVGLKYEGCKDGKLGRKHEFWLFG